MSKPVINIDDIKMQTWPAGASLSGTTAERYEAKTGFVGVLIGAKKLGYNITAIPPGKSAFPLHNHHINEEMFFILQGTGEVRFGEATHPIRTGDFIACPPGGKEVAHKIVNTGADDLRYLAVSTKMTPEIVDYPDSGKFGILAEYPQGADEKPQRFVFVGREQQSLAYWDGE
jgi:uncharacterized cupin superfamily protein